MAALDFPDSPTIGDIFGSSGVLWRWDGTRWASMSSTAGAKGVVCPIKYSTGQVSIVNNGTQYNAPAVAQSIPAKAGRTYRASASLGWTTTQQIADEGAFSACILFDGVLKSFAPVSVTSQFGAVYSSRVEYVWTQVADATIAMTVNGNCVISPSGAANGLIWSSATMPWWSIVEDITMEIGSSGALDTSTADARYVNIIGDTLTGQLNGIAPVAAANLTRKDYVDDRDWNMARGLIASQTDGNDYGGIGTTEVAILNGTFTAVAGRWYQMHCIAAVQNSGGTSESQITGYLGGVQVVHTRTIQNGYWKVINSVGRAQSAAAGSCAVSIKLASVAGTLCQSGGSSFTATTAYIYDVGPVTKNPYS